MSACVVVLDTNVVLDWLWFADARLDGLGAAMQDGRLALGGHRPHARGAASRAAAARAAAGAPHAGTGAAAFDRWVQVPPSRAGPACPGLPRSCAPMRTSRSSSTWR
jgi:hypothetical protein